ncbi:MAG TPA: carboxypeptidase regulatory-like domain-containing protein [Bryobacteraceae bacterium]|nr:carboxypeptidase regulatory-like domain-containing protein [Bryobacteraceae bacterium]
MLHRINHSCTGLIGLAIFSFSLNAQEFRSTLTGRIVDQSGAVIVGAKVKAIEMDTGSSYETATNGDGLYTFPLLLPGRYELTAEATGFEGFSQKGIQINADSKVSQDVKLTVGVTTDTITVVSDAAPLETIRVSAAQSITAHVLQNLPLDGHTALDAEYVGFAVISQENRDANGPSSNAGFATITMGGAAQGANEILLDGVPDIGTQGTTGRRPAFLPPPDAVTEVRTEAFNMDAAFGGAGGGSIEMTSRGGGNGLHGALSEYSNNSALQATAFFVNSVGGTKPKSEANQWAAVVGGPIWIPKVVNGKNKAFFFFTYEGIHSGGPTALFGTTPTAAERTGDFSQLASLNMTGKNYTLYDPSTAVLSGTTITRQPFPNNIIPKSSLNPIATNFVNTYMPLPNRPGVYDDTNNYGSTETAKNPYSFFQGRTDFNLSNRNKLTIAGRESMYEQANGAIFDNIAYVTNFLFRQSWGGMIDDIHSFSPTLLGDLRLGITRYDPYYNQASAGYDPTKLGFPSYITSTSTHLMMPGFTLTGYNGNGGGTTTDTPQNIYQVFNSYTKTTGTHTIKFGGEIRLQDVSSITWANSVGNYSFDAGTWVKQTGTAATPTLGGSMAEFLLGLPTSGTYAINAQSKADAYYDALFVQDDWHIHPGVTLNLGLRWEHATPTTEGHNRQTVAFNSSAINSVTQAAEAAYAKSPIALLPVSAFVPTGGVVFASPSQRSGYDTSTKSFAPRIGIAWAAMPRTVIRSGIGIFYYNYGTVGPQQPGYTATTSYVATNNNYLTPATTLSNPFPNGIQQPVGNAQGINTYLGQSITFSNPHLLNQYGIRWNLDVQRQLTPDTTLEAAYIGNHAIHLTTSFNNDALPVQYLSTQPFRDNATITALGATVANPFSGLLPGQTLNGTTTAVSSLLTPYPEFSGITQSNMNNGRSYFHQLAVKLEKRLSNGLQFFTNFSYSRLMSETTILNAGSLALAKQVASDDRPIYVSVSAIYDLPAGKGRPYLANTNRVAMFLLGNWQAGLSYTYFPCAPLGFGNVFYWGGPLHYNASNPNGATFDTTQFITASAQQLSNNFRTFPSNFSNLRIDSMNNFNVNLSKMFVIHEDVKLQFRAESYNAANRPLFESPNMTVTATTFGMITSTTNVPRAIQLALRLTF